MRRWPSRSAGYRSVPWQRRLARRGQQPDSGAANRQACSYLLFLPPLIPAIIPPDQAIKFTILRPSRAARSAPVAAVAILDRLIPRIGAWLVPVEAAAVIVVIIAIVVPLALAVLAVACP